jgi:hypothetical protein
MQKNIPFMIFFTAIVVAFASCTNPEVKNAESKLKDSQCKADFSKFLLESGMNTMALSKVVGMDKELNDFNQLQSDTTISCDSLMSAWDSFSNLVLKKSQDGEK